MLAVLFELPPNEEGSLGKEQLQIVALNSFRDRETFQLCWKQGFVASFLEKMQKLVTGYKFFSFSFCNFATPLSSQ